MFLTNASCQIDPFLIVKLKLLQLGGEFSESDDEFTAPVSAPGAVPP